MSNLNDFQKKLIDELTKEFEKLNPKQKVDNGVKRFSVGMINNCINEEEKFKQTMNKHNLTMLKVFVNQLKEDVKSFKKEFGKVFDMQIGIAKGNGIGIKQDIEELESETKKNPLYISGYKQVQLFIVSKTKNISLKDNNYNPCNNKQYTNSYVGFKTETSKVTLESGKEVSFQRIIGLEYSMYDYNYGNRDSKKVYPTLDELIQGEKYMQQRMVDLTN